MALTAVQKAGWGLADMGIVVFVVVKQLLVLAFLTTVLGVPVGLAGVIKVAFGGQSTIDRDNNHTSAILFGEFWRRVPESR